MATRKGDSTECLFCGRTFIAGKKGEDVSPQWYAKDLGTPKGDVTIALVEFDGQSATQTRLTQTPAAQEFRLLDVCPDPCNGRWMSTIESSAKESILSMSLGGPTALTPSDIEAIAAWAQLKAICWDALQGVDPALPSTVYDEFRRAHPLRWAVSAARVESQTRNEITFVRHVGLTSNGAETVLVFRATIMFHQLLFRVTLPLEGNMPPELFREMTPPGFLGIWPPKVGETAANVSWPPSPTVTKAELGGYF